MNSPNTEKTSGFTIAELRTWSIVHVGTRSYIGKLEGDLLRDAFEYHVHRALDPNRGGVQIMVMVLPTETLGQLSVLLLDPARVVVELHDAPDHTLRVLHSRVCMAMENQAREVPQGAPRIVMPGVAPSH